MNLKTPYEHLITQKLETELPLPDMADAIWQRIATELDADTPTEPEPDTALAPDSIAAKVAHYKWWGLAIGGIITIVVLLILLTKPFKKKQRNKAPAPVEQQPPSNPSTPAPDTAATVGIAPRRLPPAMVDRNRNNANTFDMPILQRNTLQNVPLLAPTVDSALTNLSPIPSADSAVRQLPPPGRKPRGVPNINDKDYRISAGKKDSS